MVHIAKHYLSAAQIKALVEDYRAGETVATCCTRYRITRSTLYRNIKKYEQLYGPEAKSEFYWQVECRRLKEVLADLMLENADLKKQVAQHRG